ncbi:hypothetical protein C5N99_10445 [Treponema medium]|uniref:InlB B-repeat-containing protein n=1 Tax=Treponema medium TaxID=58231 RepID=UPI001AF97ACB|nr:InlB B-repeat-containing protein [Treponema medium]QSH93000.1 hypothetical protein C5N99_10445 [Treponema medium]
MLTVAEGSKLTATQTPAPTAIPLNKSFDGWFKDTSCTQPWNYATDTVTKDITLYAKWRNALPLTPIEPSTPLYTVTFNTQGIGTAPAMLTVAEGSKLTAAQTPAPTAIPLNKSFGGWFKDTSCTQPWNYATDTVTKDITLYAKWRNALPLTPIEPLYTVTFNTRNLTSPLTPITVIKNHTIPATDIPNPTHRTWNFSGWYKDKNCNAQWNTASDTVTADITLYAKWTPKTLSKQDLWESKKTEGSTNYFRIPALAQTKDGTLIAVTDLRYNHTADIGKFGPNGEWGQASHIHRVDVIIKRSTDNGLTWDSSSTKITNAPDNPVQYGYGDAAIVADRESDNVLIICAHGDTRYGHYKAGNANTRLKVVKLRSLDGGKTFTSPEEITTSIYGLNDNWGTLFFGSGKIMQSRKIKKGSYYRIYAALLVKKTSKDSYGNAELFGNAVLYSDDFGETWQVLGDATVSPIPNGDEAKVEELPDGRVLLSSRTVDGRLFNIFTYTNEGTANGHWKNAQRMPLENERGTNGEICIIKVRKTDTKAPVYLALQSIPLSSKPHPKSGEPNIRMNVGIYWRVIEENISLSALADSTKWEKYQIFTGESGYSTMVMQQDHRIGFLYEKYDHITHSTDMNDVYDIRYETLPISTITNGEYEAAFLTE